MALKDLDAMLRAAMVYAGVKEIPGPKSNPQIIAFYAAAGIDVVRAKARAMSAKAKEYVLGADDSTTAWCGAFMAQVVTDCGFTPPKNAFRARAWLTWGMEMDYPFPGCAAILSRPPNPAHGHVAIYLAHTPDGKKVALYGGNQNNEVCVRLYDVDRVLSYRHPVCQ